jgi:hypothetical protein
MDLPMLITLHIQTMLNHGLAITSCSRRPALRMCLLSHSEGPGGSKYSKAHPVTVTHGGLRVWGGVRAPRPRSRWGSELFFYIFRHAFSSFQNEKPNKISRAANKTFYSAEGRRPCQNGAPPYVNRYAYSKSRLDAIAVSHRSQLRPLVTVSQTLERE